MKTNSILIATLIGLTALGGAAVAQDTGYEDDGFSIEEQQLPQRAQQMRNGPRARQGQMTRARGQRGGQRMIQQLNLSSEQQALMQQGRQNFQPKAKKIRTQIRSLQQQRAALFQSGDFEALHRLIDKQTTLKAKLQHQRLKSMQDFHDSLSPQQLETLQQALSKKAKAHQGQRGQRRGARRGGPRANQSRQLQSVETGWDE